MLTRRVEMLEGFLGNPVFKWFVSSCLLCHSYLAFYERIITLLSKF